MKKLVFRNSLTYATSMSALGALLIIGAGIGAYDTFANCGKVDFGLFFWGVLIAVAELVGVAIFLYFLGTAFDRNPQLEIDDECLIDHRNDSKTINWQKAAYLDFKKDNEYGFDGLVILLESGEKIEIGLEGLNFHSVEIFQMAKAMHMGNYLAATRRYVSKVSFASLFVRNVVAYTIGFVIIFSLFGLIPLLNAAFCMPQFIVPSIIWWGKISIVAGLILGVVFGLFSSLLGKFAVGMAS